MQSIYCESDARCFIIDIYVLIDEVLTRPYTVFYIILIRLGNSDGQDMALVSTRHQK